jgi:hypothetical protein
MLLGGMKNFGRTSGRLLLGKGYRDRIIMDSISQASEEESTVLSLFYCLSVCHGDSIRELPMLCNAATFCDL